MRRERLRRREMVPLRALPARCLRYSSIPDPSRAERPYHLEADFENNTGRVARLAAILEQQPS